MTRILVIGLGLIGGTYAKALAQNDLYAVDAYDINEQTLMKAKQEQVIERGFSKINDIEDVYDIVIISLYPDDVITFIQECGNRFSKRAIICDVAGLQGVIVKQLQSFLNIHQLSYISLHPMAGREQFGYEMSQSTLFSQKSCLYTNVTANSKQLDMILTLHQEIGFSCIKEVSADLHDALIAYTSQLPHVISVAFMNAWDNREVKGFTGGSFEDMTRVADINAHLWSSLFLENKMALLEEIKGFKGQLELFEKALLRNDEVLLRQLMSHSSDAKKHVVNQLLQGGDSDVR